MSGDVPPTVGMTFTSEAMACSNILCGVLAFVGEPGDPCPGCADGDAFLARVSVSVDEVTP